MKINTFRIQSNNSIICGYFCIGVNDFIFAGKTLLVFTRFFTHYVFEKNDDIIVKHFKDE